MIVIADATPLHYVILIDRADLLPQLFDRVLISRRNLSFIGTLGVLREAARRELLDLRATLAELQRTTFYVDPALITSPLEEDDRRRGPLS
jgi:predicted nucleic acid-binding protein